MKMKTLTNNHGDMKVVDLDKSVRGRGPYLITQVGIAPNDDSCRERMFVLRRDACWIDLNVYLSSGRPESLDDAVFNTIHEVLGVMSRLPAAPAVIELPVSMSGLRAWLERNSSGSLIERLEMWLVAYRQSGRNNGQGITDASAANLPASEATPAP